MNVQVINRLIGLVKKTGERLILADPESGDAVVVMDLDSYEALISAITDESVHEQEQQNEPEEVLQPYAPDIAPAQSKPQPASKPKIGSNRFAQPNKTTGNYRSENKLASVIEQHDNNTASRTPKNNADTLTKSGIGDNINREIGRQNKGYNQAGTTPEKASVPVGQNTVSQSNVHRAPSQNSIKPEESSAFEEEERFYLEPIE